MYELSPPGSVVFSKNQTTRQQQLLSSVTRRISGLQTTKLYTLTLPSGQGTESSLNSPFDLQETEHSPQITYQVTSQVTAWSHSYFSITAVDTHMGSSSSSSTLEVPPALILMGCSQLLLRLKESDLPTAFSVKQRNLSSTSPSALLILRSMIKKKENKIRSCRRRGWSAHCSSLQAFKHQTDAVPEPPQKLHLFSPVTVQIQGREFLWPFCKLKETTAQRMDETPRPRSLGMCTSANWSHTAPNPACCPSLQPSLILWISWWFKILFKTPTAMGVCNELRLSQENLNLAAHVGIFLMFLVIVKNGAVRV